MLEDTPPPSSEQPGGSGRLYPRLLGAAWQALEPAVQRAHTAEVLTHAEGTFQVSRAPGRVMGRILDLARVPPSSSAASVRLVVHQSGRVERWERSFGGRLLVTLQWEAPGGLLAEQAGVLEFRFRLAVKHGALVFRQEGFALRLGPLRLPLPEWLAIKVACREGPASGPDGLSDQTMVDVRVTGPTGGLLFAYRGTMRWRSGEARR
jgi:hypothetical protein